MVEIMLEFFSLEGTLFYEGIILWLCMCVKIMLWEKEEEFTTGFVVGCIPSFVG